MTGYILDTSIFIAREQGRTLGHPPAGEARISVATLTELSVGVRRSVGPLRAVREATLANARRFIPLPFDERVAEHLAEILAVAAVRKRRAAAMDAIIAATALAHGLTVWTQDSDFETLAVLAPDLVVHAG